MAWIVDNGAQLLVSFVPRYGRLARQAVQHVQIQFWLQDVQRFCSLCPAERATSLAAP
jgi:hypothetical protein